MPDVRRYLSVFWGVLLMLLKLPRCLSDVRAPLVEDLKALDFQKMDNDFKHQITENSRKISRKSCKFSFLKDFFFTKCFWNLGISNRSH